MCFVRCCRNALPKDSLAVVSDRVIYDDAEADGSGWGVLSIFAVSFGRYLINVTQGNGTHQLTSNLH